MKIKLSDAYNILEGLNSLMDKDLNTKFAYKIQKNYKKVGDEVKTADEVRNKTGEKYKKFTDKQGRIKDDYPEKKKEFQGEIAELMEQEVDIELWTIKLDELGESVKPRVLVLLDKIIVEGEEE